MASIQKLMADVLRIPEARVTDTMTMQQTVEWDSLKHMELIAAMEQHYAIELTGDEIAEMISVAAIKKILTKYGK